MTLYAVRVRRLVEEIITVAAASKDDARSKVNHGIYDDDEVTHVDTINCEIIKVVMVVE